MIRDLAKGVGEIALVAVFVGIFVGIFGTRGGDRSASAPLVYLPSLLPGTLLAWYFEANTFSASLPQAAAALVVVGGITAGATVLMDMFSRASEGGKPYSLPCVLRATAVPVANVAAYALHPIAQSIVVGTLSWLGSLAQ